MLYYESYYYIKHAYIHIYVLFAYNTYLLGRGYREEIGM